MKITEEQIVANYELHIKIIDKYLPEERATAVKAMINSIGEESYATAPASGKNWYHGAYAGGYGRRYPFYQKPGDRKTESGFCCHVR